MAVRKKSVAGKRSRLKVAQLVRDEMLDEVLSEVRAIISRCEGELASLTRDLMRISTEADWRVYMRERRLASKQKNGKLTDAGRRAYLAEMQQRGFTKVDARNGWMSPKFRGTPVR
jgi:hypothetical protein